MRNSDFWLSVETEADRGNTRAKVGPMRVALLFGVMAIAMALFLPPMVDHTPRLTAYNSGGLDMISTGSIPMDGSRSYTVRRSILDEPGVNCVYDGMGRVQGHC
ncbi:hypothetical protein [Pararhizobium haloflavum]|uniref:hypothetical protein n=1 Tax=Pararhizobium haloflavum TaxID=2037914 RepID=UPI000C19A880|nr:hypothetical protein [Pararhizobium haloflavum]